MEIVEAKELMKQEKYHQKILMQVQKRNTLFLPNINIGLNGTLK